MILNSPKLRGIAKPTFSRISFKKMNEEVVCKCLPDSSLRHAVINSLFLGKCPACRIAFQEKEQVKVLRFNIVCLLKQDAIHTLEIRCHATCFKEGGYFVHLMQNKCLQNCCTLEGVAAEAPIHPETLRTRALVKHLVLLQQCDVCHKQREKFDLCNTCHRAVTCVKSCTPKHNCVLKHLPLDEPCQEMTQSEARRAVKAKFGKCCLLQCDKKSKEKHDLTVSWVCGSCVSGHVFKYKFCSAICLENYQKEEQQPQ